jgi:hypothetical protein
MGIIKQLNIAVMRALRLAFIAPVLLAVAPSFGQNQDAGEDLPYMIVYKNPSCGCCSHWIKHVEEYGFEARTYTTKNPDVLKDRLGVPRNVRSCHVAEVDGYIIEGHVPADLIEKLLTERPDVAGLAVPGMVVGSPGMEGRNPQHYDVVAFTKDGKSTVYASR